MDRTTKNTNGIENIKLMIKSFTYRVLGDLYVVREMASSFWRCLHE